MSPFVCVVHWLAVVGSSIYTCLVGCIHEWCEDILTHKHKFTSSHVDMYIHTHKHPSAHPLHMYTHMYICTYLVSLSIQDQVPRPRVYERVREEGTLYDK